MLGVDLFPPFVAEAAARAADAGVTALCEFEIADVCERLDTLRDYDAAVLAGVGCAVLGGFARAVGRMRESVRPGGFIVIDDCFLAHASSFDRPGYEHYHDHGATRRELALHGDVLVREVVLPAAELAAENRRNNEAIGRRAAELRRRHPECAEAITRFVQWEEEECEVLETQTKAAVWLLRRR